jgi:hypothetical protein
VHKAITHKKIEISASNHQTVVSYATRGDGPYVTGKESIANEIDKEEKIKSGYKDD